MKNYLHPTHGYEVFIRRRVVKASNVQVRFAEFLAVLHIVRVVRVRCGRVGRVVRGMLVVDCRLVLDVCLETEKEWIRVEKNRME